jgi:hypothetical protein
MYTRSTSYKSTLCHRSQINIVTKCWSHSFTSDVHKIHELQAPSLLVLSVQSAKVLSNYEPLGCVHACHAWQTISTTHWGHLPPTVQLKKQGPAMMLYGCKYLLQVWCWNLFVARYDALKLTCLYHAFIFPCRAGILWQPLVQTSLAAGVGLLQHCYHKATSWFMVAWTAITSAWVACTG